MTPDERLREKQTAQTPGPLAAVRTRIVLRVAIVASVVLALLLVHVGSRWGVRWRLITFTYQANLLAALFYSWTLISPRVDARAGLRGAVVVYVLVAGVVWNAFLTDMSMGYTAANVLLHVVMPLLVLAEWVLVGRGQPALQWWQPLVWLAYPAGYLGAALLVLNQLGRRAPYFFLDPASAGALRVVLNVSLLAAIFLGLGYGLLALGRMRVDQPEVEPPVIRSDAGKSR
ncbi:MAG: hypothetical protein QOH57_4032 [Mycobacterium sp.]|jgi:hypothetical protein|nr:hypothetical protein [Mycobacterium sp.]